MNVLVMGGRGFIGGKLVHALVGKNCLVDSLTRHNVDALAKKNECFVSYIKCDLLDLGFDFHELVGKYDIVFNCAGELHDKSLMRSLHVEATGRLVDACKTMAQKRNRAIHWVQLSSVGAYGPSQPKANVQRVVSEETITAPVGEYEVTKTQADKLIMDAADDFFSYTILRPSNVYGSDMSNNSIRKLASMIKKGLFFYIGKPGAISNYVHVCDVVDALISCGFDSRARDQVFNLSNDCEQAVVINALADYQCVTAPHFRLNESFVRLIVLLFSWLPHFPLSKSRVDSLVSRTYYDSSKIEYVIGFKPSRDVRETIVEVIE